MMEERKGKGEELSPKYSVEGYILEAEKAFSNDALDLAIDNYKKALTYTNYRKDEEQAARILVSLGDCFYLKKDYKEARRYYQKAFELPNGVSNAYVLLRMGELFFDEGNQERAKYYLLQAYLIEGAELFEDEDRKYLNLIKDEELVLLEDEPEAPAEQKERADESVKENGFSLRRALNRWINGKDGADS